MPFFDVSIFVVLFVFSYFLARINFYAHRLPRKLSDWWFSLIPTLLGPYVLIVELGIGSYFIFEISQLNILFYPAIVGLSMVFFAFVLTAIPLVYFFFDNSFFDLNLNHIFQIKNFKRFSPSFLRLFKLGPYRGLKKTFEFKNRDEKKLEIDFYANQNAKAPLAFVVFGGGYTMGDKNQLSNYNLFLVKQGYHVVAASYRFLPISRWPGLRHDIEDCWHFVKGHLFELGIEPAFYVWSGRSAGAHISMITCSKLKDPEIKGIINFYPPFDFEELHSYSHDDDILTSKKRLKKLYGEFHPADKNFQDGNPALWITTPEFPPCLNLHGDHDALIPYTQSIKLGQRLDQLGVLNYTLILPFESHVFDANLNSPGGQRASYATTHFLRYLKENYEKE
jgi:acetyl esterase/lipase